MSLRPTVLVPLLAAAALFGAAAGPAATLDLFDANPRYTPGVGLPLPSYDAASIEPMTTPSWDAAARPVARVASDGVSLLVVRIALPPADASSVRVSVVSDVVGSDPGTLWSISDGRLVDDSARGGEIDDIGLVGVRTITVPSFAVGSQRFAFVLYRSPRDFDGAGVSDLAGRTARISAQTTTSSADKTITLVRPLVVFLHGTSADNDAWAPFPLWRDSANEVHGFTGGTLPFQATRISFSWIWNATGGVEENAGTILPQLVTALRDWREATGTAATQADVITHSFGGFIARQVVQTQPDSNPLGKKFLRNFRSASNWGHGSIHKLITLASTHRGAASANASAFLNAKGSLPGYPREAACQAGSYIDKGALRDQMVLSPALKALGETRVPGHAVAGSGRAVLDPSNSYRTAFTFLPLTDKSDGPYRTAANSPCSLDGLANYIFNLDANDPPVSGSDKNNNCSVTPNYDLVVSEHSSLGLLTGDAVTTAASLSLVGVLNHSAIHDPYFGSAEIVQKVSDRLEFLLRQPTAGSSFARFPAVASAPLTPAETGLAAYDPAGLEFGQKCPAPVYNTSCPTYTSLQAVPSKLTLEDSTPTPISVYGLLNGEWVLAYSPALTSSSRDCPITFQSSNPSVAAISTNDVTGAQTVVAASPGNATISISVKGFSTPLTVPVSVAGGLLGSAGGCTPDAETLCLSGGRFRVRSSWAAPDGRAGAGRATSLTPDAGDFWFFNPDNVEVIVKIVDGRPVNSSFWVFAGGLTNVQAKLTVTDTETGAERTYVNPQSTPFQPVQDLTAFREFGFSTLDLRPSTSDRFTSSAACEADGTTLCLNNGRFRVQARWTTPDGKSGFGQSVQLTGDTGDFWFFTPNNPEVLVKVLNGCSSNSRFWTFAAGLTNVNVVLTVTDTQTGGAKSYTNLQGSAFQPIQDTAAFATCP